MELNREHMVNILKQYLGRLNRTYDLEQGAEKHLAEMIIDDGEQKCMAEIDPARQFNVVEEIADKDTGMTMTASLTFIFTHVDAVPKKKIITLEKKLIA